MKKIVILLVICLTTIASIAQTAQTPKTTIDVTGRADYKPEIDFYKADIIISENYRYNYNSSKCFNDLKKDYFEELAKNKIDTLQFKENKKGYLYENYDLKKEGSLYSFKTKDEALFLKVLQVKTDGVKISKKDAYFKKLTTSEIVDLKKRALDNAKKEAEYIAKALNKKIVGIDKIRASNYISKIKDDIYYIRRNKVSNNNYIYVTYILD